MTLRKAHDNEEARIRFEVDWKAYPCRNGKRLDKGAAFKRWEQQVKVKDRDLFSQAVRNYGDSDLGRRSPKDMKRFISNRDNDEYWRQWIEAERYPENPQYEVHERRTVSGPSGPQSIGSLINVGGKS